MNEFIVVNQTVDGFLFRYVLVVFECSFVISV